MCCTWALHTIQMQANTPNTCTPRSISWCLTEGERVGAACATSFFLSLICRLSRLPLKSGCGVGLVCQEQQHWQQPASIIPRTYLPHKRRMYRPRPMLCPILCPACQGPPLSGVGRGTFDGHFLPFGTMRVLVLGTSILVRSMGHQRIPVRVCDAWYLLPGASHCWVAKRPTHGRGRERGWGQR